MKTSLDCLGCINLIYSIDQSSWDVEEWEWKMTVKRLEVYLVNLDPTQGKEITKTIPCLIISPFDLTLSGMYSGDILSIKLAIIDFIQK
jgi:hypothetical protein